MWATDGNQYEPADLICDGCYGEKISKDSKICWVKECINKKMIENCAYYTEYPCETLASEWSTWRVLSGVEVEVRLDRIRKNLREGV